jgi:hypothetical protein
MFRSVFVTIDKSGTPIGADAISPASQICEYLGHNVYPRASLALGPGGCVRRGAGAGGTIWTSTRPMWTEFCVFCGNACSTFAAAAAVRA